MIFEYLQRITVEGQLDVDNIGDCTLLARNDFGEEFYLIIKTELGWTEVIEWGPVAPDIGLLPTTVSITYNRFEYNEYRLEKLIDKFLNNPKRGITQAQITDLETIRPFMVNLVDRVFPKLD